MKTTFTLLIFLFCFLNARAQDSLKNFNYSRNNITATGMEVLGSWAVINTGVGLTGWAGSKGGENRAFYQMTTIWGVTNLGAAFLGYTSAKKEMDKPLTSAESLKAQEKIERIFLVNGGLDIAYIGTGIFLKSHGDSHNFAELKGYGSSIIFQGAFLLLFDGTMYSTHRNNGSKLRRFLEKNPITYNGKQLGIIFKP